ncbi:MAG: sulfurtransferase TusA family protein [Acetobacterales bacterium]
MTTEVASYYLDITQELCPMTFVRTKLLIEKMPPGAICEIRLKGQEPLENVPRSIREHGHEVIDLEPEGGGEGPDRIHRLTVRKNG